MGKFKVGDCVMVKSLKWYEENMKKKSGTGGFEVKENAGIIFNEKMMKYCGKILTIENDDDKYYKTNGNIWNWCDEMFEEIPMPKLEISNKKDFLLTDEDIKYLVHELMGYEFYYGKIYDGDYIVNVEKYIGDNDIRVFSNLLLLIKNLCEQKGYVRGKNEVKQSIKDILGIV